MSFTSEIRDFCKARLHSTSTTVTQLDGSKWIETRPSTEQGYVVSRSSSDSCSAGYGYVVDVVPDLQIGWILPNLLLGHFDNFYQTRTIVSFEAHEDERAVLYKTKSLDGTKPNTNPNLILTVTLN